MIFAMNFKMLNSEKCDFYLIGFEMLHMRGGAVVGPSSFDRFRRGLLYSQIILTDKIGRGLPNFSKVTLTDPTRPMGMEQTT